MDRKRELEILSARIVEGMRSVSHALIEIAPVLYELEGRLDVAERARGVLDRISRNMPIVEAGQADLLASLGNGSSGLDKAIKLAAIVEGIMADTRELSKLVDFRDI